MAPRLVTDSQLVDRLTGLFRQVGYDGASLGAIAAATERALRNTRELKVRSQRLGMSLSRRSEW